MITLMERAVVQALFSYMEKKGLRQTELAEKLVWSQSDLNDTLRGRKGIGKNRQEYLEKKLGKAFKHELFLQISELSETEKQKGRVAEKPLEDIAGKYALSDTEERYVEMLLGILRGRNREAKVAIKSNIGALFRYRKERQDITKGHLEQLLEVTDI